MKKHIFKSLILILCVFTGINTYANNFVIDGIRYKISSSTDKTVSVAEVLYNGSVVVIPETVTYGTTYSVTSIGDGAFYYCSGLTDVTIPNSVTHIGNYAFQDCSGLTSVTIPNSVTSIGNYAFCGCTGLTSIIVEQGNTHFDSRENCNAIIETDTNKLIQGCNSTIIPNSVTSIGDYAFYKCRGLTSVTIPNSITRIAYGAFSGCSGILSVTIPNSVTSIESYVFCGCNSLTSVTIPSSVTSIGEKAFAYCSGLTSVTIPNAVTSIGNSSFEDCTSLKEVRIEDGEETLSLGYNESNEGLFYDCPLKNVYLGRNLNYDTGYNYGYSPFYNKKTLKTVSIGNNVTSIADYAFSNCTGLTSVTIPNSVTSIGADAFYGCGGLTSVTIPNSVTSIGSYAFYDCDGLTSVMIGNSVTSIGKKAFAYCSDLTSVTIPNAVTSIGNSAFDNCTSLKEVRIEDGEETLSLGYNESNEEGLFYDCPLENVYLGRNLNYDTGYIYGYSPFYNKKTLKTVSIGNNVTSIADNAFMNCLKLTSVTIPNSVTSIGSSAFSGCTGLTSVTIPNSVTSIGGEAFYNCNCYIYVSNSSMTVSNKTFDSDCTVILNNTVYIDNNTSDISSLYWIDIICGLIVSNDVTTITGYLNSKVTKTIWLTNTPPEGYTKLSSKVHYVANDQYTGLSNVTIYPYLSSMFEVDGIKYVPVSPSERTCDAIDCAYDSTSVNINIDNTVSFKGIEMTVKDIKPYTCYSNKNIKSVKLNCNVNIGENAFYGCSVLENAEIKANAIGNDAFSNCWALETLTINTDSIGDFAFFGCSALKALTVNTDNIGKGAFSISASKESAVFDINAKTLGDYAFNRCTKVESITLSDDLTSIGNNVFENCSNLKEIEIPNSVTSLGECTFSDCSSLESVTIGTGVTAINQYTFSNCSKLSNITIPSNVKSIGNYVFNNCSSLTQVSIADRDTELSLGSNGSNPLFYSCPLDSVYIGGNISYPTTSSKGYSPFYRNTKLRSVVITDNETEISENEFYGCTNLKNISMGDGVEKIGNWAFSGCSSLEHFAFGSGMKSIGNEAFSDCTAMTKLISKTSIPPTCGTQALDDINKWSCELYVPQSAVSAYQGAEQWKEFFFITGETSGVNDNLYNDGSTPIEYYNLNGVKVENPEKGIYIKKQGGKTTKVVL